MKSSNVAILVVGGAGYIGSQVVYDLHRLGYSPVIVDNFVTGNRDIASILGVPIEEGDIADEGFLERIFKKFTPSAVMHFAAFAYVGESVIDPQKYYLNNLCATVKLLNTMVNRKVNRFIFSSTCATYGVPKRIPITEETPQNPINPYGWTKFMIEQVLKDYDRAYGLKSVIFRYFNAAGASEEIKIGERHDPETHLIPLVLSSAAKGTPQLVFGNDYPTRDGTCVRDYVHVSDISHAHVLGLKALLCGEPGDIFNIGTGRGYTVEEVIQTIERISGKNVLRVIRPRRDGDPPELVASPEKIQRRLSWAPRYIDMESIVRSAYRWYLHEAERPAPGFCRVLVRKG